MLKWWLSLRPFSFTASVIPMFLGLAAAARITSIDRVGAVLALVTGLTLHIVANLFNSYFDWKLGHDKPGDPQVIPLLLDPKLGDKALLRYGVAFLILGTFLTAVLGILYNLTVLIISLFGLFNAYFYTAPPINYKKRGLALPSVFISMGILMPLNTYFVQTMDLTLDILLCPIPLAFLVTAILQSNELRDYGSDLRHGINSLTAVYGIKVGIKVYQLMITIPYLLVPILIASSLVSWWAAAVFATLPYALSLIGRADRHYFSGLDSSSAKLHAMFGLLYASSYFM